AVQAVNDCILTEMNGLDSNVLRNSCLMEQQALDRIETLKTSDREMAIAKLLGIEALQRIEQDLKVVRKDEALLAQAQVRLDVARQRQEARDAEEATHHAMAQVRAARARAAVIARDTLAARLQEARGSLTTVTHETAQLYERSQRAITLAALLARSDENARLLRDAEQQATALEMMRARQGHGASAAELENSRSTQLAQVDADIVAAETLEHEQRAQIALARRRARSSGWLAIAVFLAIAVMLAVILLLQLPWLLLPVFVLLGIGVVLTIRWQNSERAEADGRAKLATIEREMIRLRATHEAVRSFSVAAGEQETPETLTAQRRQAETARETCAVGLQAMAAALTQVGVAIPDGKPALESATELRRAHEALLEPLQAELTRLDVQATQRTQGGLDAREQQLRALCDDLDAQWTHERATLAPLLAEQGIASATGDEPLAGLVARWPALAHDGDPIALAATLERASTIEEQLRLRVEALAHQHGLDAATLDVEACQIAYDELEQSLRQRRLASEMADEVFKRIVQRVLPETETHMRALLPELTDGRYRDVRLLNDEGDSASLDIGIWEEQAGRFVGKHLFSGGARDQVSLALRLAFALATLPKELGAMPGFIFLDEPLSSFDDRRSQALVDVLTRGPIARQFPQVFLISHSQSFDPGAFTCSLRMAEGRIAHSTLPDEQQARALWEASLTPAAN
ncbi:MAG TPA: ABC transporter ATP-binding protein, partial [Ktedonobacterales bacterium]